MAARSQDLRGEQRPVGRLLLIADEVAVLDAVTDYFTDLGYEVQSALESEEAVAVFHARPDVILLDVPTSNLPKVMSDVRSRWSTIPVIVAAASAATAHQIHALGIFACVQKPFIWDVLRWRVATAVSAAVRGSL